ncbi:MAG: hypothetical protein IT293_19295 [Deltaproteobacteria bacterium]|nr:hypothetical protein [Deltaproteobacteria bacterium]
MAEKTLLGCNGAVVRELRKQCGFTPNEIDAVKQFVEDGNVGVLMKRIGTTNRTAVNGLVTRVAGYLARIGRSEPPLPRKRPKLLGLPKVHAVLEQMGRTADEFTAIHTTLPGKQARVTIQPSAAELSAVEEFLKTGDANALRAKLTRKDRGYLNALVTRVLAWKARQVHPA